ncbi:isoamylase [Trifolium repens]|nr:isoamylase [Trifolium repens]
MYSGSQNYKTRTLQKYIPVNINSKFTTSSKFTRTLQNSPEHTFSGNSPLVFPDGSINFAVFQGMHVESVVLYLYDDDDDDDDDTGVEKPALEIDLDPYVNMNHAFDHGLLKKEP